MNQPATQEPIDETTDQEDEEGFPLIRFDLTSEGLADLRKRFGTVPDAGDPEGYELCKAGVKEMTSLRTSIEARRKELKAPALRWSQKLDALAKRLIADIKKIEAPLAKEKERIDDIARAEARKAAEAEQQRVADIGAAIKRISDMAAEQRTGDTSETYAKRIDTLKALPMTQDVYAEFLEDANTARDAALYKLGQWHEAAVAREAQERQLAEQAEQLRLQQEAIDKQQREIEERERAASEKQAAADAAAKAAEDKAAAEEAERAAEKQRQQVEAEQAEADRVRAIQERINTLRTMPERFAGFPAATIASSRESMATMTPTAEQNFGEFLAEAQRVHREVLATLDDMHAAAVEDERQAEIARKQAEEDEERARLARLSDAEKIREWSIALRQVSAPHVLDTKAQKIVQRNVADLDAFLDRLENSANKL